MYLSLVLNNGANVLTGLPIYLAALVPILGIVPLFFLHSFPPRPLSGKATARPPPVPTKPGQKASKNHIKQIRKVERPPGYRAPPVSSQKGIAFGFTKVTRKHKLAVRNRAGAKKGNGLRQSRDTPTPGATRCP